MVKNGSINQDQAILLKSISFGEAHKVLHFITLNHGKLSLVAHGAQKSQKRFLGSLDYLNLLEIEFSQGSQKDQMGSLISITLLQEFKEIKRNYESMSLALYWLKLFSQNIPHGELEESMFYFLKQALEKLGAMDPPWAALWFQKYFLEKLGYSLNFESCYRCQRHDKNEYFFDPEEGAIHCIDCHINTLEDMACPCVPEQFWELHQSPLVKFHMESLSQVLNYAIQRYLGKSL